MHNKKINKLTSYNAQVHQAYVWIVCNAPCQKLSEHSTTQEFLFLAIAALYKLPSDKSSYLLMAKIYSYIELPSSRLAAMIRKTDRIGAHVGLWDTTLKFLSPGLRNNVTDHLVSFKFISLQCLT